MAEEQEGEMAQKRNRQEIKKWNELHKIKRRGEKKEKKRRRRKRVEEGEKRGTIREG